MRIGDRKGSTSLHDPFLTNLDGRRTPTRSRTALSRTSRNLAGDRKFSVVSVGPGTSTLQTIPASSNTDLNTCALGLDPQDPALRPQTRFSTSEVHELGVQDPRLSNQRIAGPEPQTLVDRRDAPIPAWRRLISQPLPTDERVSLIATIFSDRNEVDTVNLLRGDDAQTFVNVIDEVPSRSFISE